MLFKSWVRSLMWRGLRCIHRYWLTLGHLIAGDKSEPTTEWLNSEIIPKQNTHSEHSGVLISLVQNWCIKPLFWGMSQCAYDCLVYSAYFLPISSRTWHPEGMKIMQIFGSRQGLTETKKTRDKSIFTTQLEQWRATYHKLRMSVHDSWRESRFLQFLKFYFTLIQATFPASRP